MVQFASYLRHKTRLIFPRINGPNVLLVSTTGNKKKRNLRSEEVGLDSCYKNTLGLACS